MAWVSYAHPYEDIFAKDRTGELNPSAPTCGILCQMGTENIVIRLPKVSSEELYHCRGAPEASRPQRDQWFGLWPCRESELLGCLQGAAANRAAGSDSPSFEQSLPQVIQGPTMTPRIQYVHPRPHPRPVRRRHIGTVRKVGGTCMSCIGHVRSSST